MLPMPPLHSRRPVNLLSPKRRYGQSLIYDALSDSLRFPADGSAYGPSARLEYARAISSARAENERASLPLPAHKHIRLNTAGSGCIQTGTLNNSKTSLSGFVYLECPLPLIQEDCTLNETHCILSTFLPINRKRNAIYARDLLLLFFMINLHLPRQWAPEIMALL